MGGEIYLLQEIAAFNSAPIPDRLDVGRGLSARDPVQGLPDSLLYRMEAPEPAPGIRGYPLRQIRFGKKALYVIGQLAGLALAVKQNLLPLLKKSFVQGAVWDFPGNRRAAYRHGLRNPDGVALHPVR